MRLTQLHNKNYTELNQGYQLVLPLSLEGLIPEDDSVRLLSHILEELDIPTQPEKSKQHAVEI